MLQTHIKSIQRALTIVLAGGWVLAAELSCGPAVASETPAEKPAGAESTNGADAPNDTEANPDVEKKQKSLQETLQEELLGKGQAQVTNPVESILEQMRRVQARLEKTATDKETRQEQTQIVESIDKLIDALKNQKPPPPQSSNPDSGSPPPPPSGGKPDENQQSQGTPQPRPGNSKKQQDTKTDQKPKEQGGQQKQPGQTESVSDKARDSNQSSAKRPRSAEEEAARQRTAKDVWGHLPETIRQELLNIFSEKYIPKYDEQLRRYYEALAEQNGEEL